MGIYRTRNGKGKMRSMPIVNAMAEIMSVERTRPRLHLQDLVKLHRTVARCRGTSPRCSTQHET